MEGPRDGCMGMLATATALNPLKSIRALRGTLSLWSASGFDSRYSVSNMTSRDKNSRPYIFHLRFWKGSWFLLCCYALVMYELSTIEVLRPWCFERLGSFCPPENSSPWCVILKQMLSTR